MKLFFALALSTWTIGVMGYSQDSPKGHLVFVLGEREYGTLESVPKWFDKHLKPEGYKGTFIVAQPEDEVRNHFEGMAEAVADADLVFVSVRRRAPEKEGIDALKAHVAAGKPIIAIRTSSHAFHIKGAPVPEGHDIWEEFDPEILGGNYSGHYKAEMATVSAAEGVEGHPVLKGLGELPKSDKLYRANPLADTTTLLLSGKIEGHDAEPMAWLNEVGEHGAKVFYTSMGQRSDFESAVFQQLLKQAVEWALN
ncbi:MAG: ThuA domain-containing protein [Verrucomicrobiales bacterium]